MKKILFFTSESCDNPKRGTPIRIYNFIEQLSQSNEVIVVAPNIDARLRVTRTDWPGIGPWRQAKALARLVKSERIDLVITATEINIIVPVLARWLTGVRLAIDLHGLYAEELYYQGLIGRFKKNLIDKFVKFFLKLYDLVFVCSPKLAEYYRLNEKNSVVIYEGVNEKYFFKTGITPPEIFTIGYAGNNKSYQGIGHLLAACQSLRQKQSFPFRLNLIISSGASEINEMLQKYDLIDLATLHAKVEQSKVNEIVAHSSVLVVPRPSLTMTEYAFPSKLPKDLISGIPTITTDVGPVKRLFGQCNCCVIIDSANITQNLEKALEMVYHMSPSERAEMGQRAVAFVGRNLKWATLGEKINQAIEQVS
jgi:glycosyltransferase involved in cell wall biosynthesis